MCAACMCVCVCVPLYNTIYFLNLLTLLLPSVYTRTHTHTQTQTHTLILYYSVYIHNIVYSIHIPTTYVVLYVCYFRRTGASLLLM